MRGERHTTRRAFNEGDDNDNQAPSCGSSRQLGCCSASPSTCTDGCVARPCQRNESIASASPHNEPRTPCTLSPGT